MSERKVLNKYYPPDFDPSKIPKCKIPGGRNKTFVIRLMAPCNMRCTTCGEYIYKGRKFNARKEDVEDMDYLGLRIYRFYIKCTACVSEICFRTDPENTDYVLESGATRNFEALHRAQQQAEDEAEAYKEELASNPMKLLEERTLASKNEMELVEALEELRELNKRTVKVDYNTMLTKYDDIRQAVIDKEEAEDEEFVKAVFSKEGGVNMKRIVDESSSSEEDKPKVKVAKVAHEAVTDILTEGSAVEKQEAKKNVWEKSVGGLSSFSGKKGLGVLVKKKEKPVFVKPKQVGSVSASSGANAASQAAGSVSASSGANAASQAASASLSDQKSTSSAGGVNGAPGGSGSNNTPGGSGASKSSGQAPPAGGSALGLLGAYSDSDSNTSD